MAILSRDTWTGGDDVDIEGRTPDGVGGVALGTWTHHDNSSGRLDIESGVVRANGANPTAYVLEGTGNGNDYRVEATFKRLDLDLTAFAYAAVGARWTDDSFDTGYTFFYYIESATESYVEVYWSVDDFDFGFFGMQVLPTLVPINTEFTLAIEVEGSTIRCYVDDDLVISDTETSVAGPGSGLMAIDNGNSTDTWECLNFTVMTLDDEPEPPTLDRQFAAWV